MIPVLDVYPQKGLVGDAVLGKFQFVQLSAADGWNIVTVVSQVRVCGANIEDIFNVWVPGIVVLRTCKTTQ